MNLTRTLSRRQVLIGGAALAGLAPRVQAQEERIAFFFVSDTHYLADRTNPARLDPVSAEINAALIDQLNRLPGTDIPMASGGGRVLTPLGVIHGGDLVDSADKNGAPFTEMIQREWAGFQEGFGVTGREGKLRFPVYEVHGNHDGPQSQGLIVDGIRERNRRRVGLKHVSSNGLHYSWDWGPFHFVNLGIVVGSSPESRGRGRYHARESLPFLVEDLEKHVGKSGRPVILTHHVDVGRYTGACNPEAAPSGLEWDPCDVRAYHVALRNYRIAAVLHGHTHVRSISRWDGASTRAEKGIQVLNVDNSAHFSGPAQAFFYLEATPKELVVREVQTTDGWKTASWTPQVWVLGVGP